MQFDDDEPPPEAPREGWVLCRIHVPELDTYKCLQFPVDKLIWDVKQQVLASLPKVRKLSTQFWDFFDDAQEYSNTIIEHFPPFLIWFMSRDEKHFFLPTSIEFSPPFLRVERRSNKLSIYSTKHEHVKYFFDNDATWSCYSSF